MKKVLIVLISTLLANGVAAQTTFNSLIGSCSLGVIENDKMEHFKFINSQGKSVSCSIDEMYALLRKDVVSYFGLEDTYNSELKIKAYKQTEEYKNNYSLLMADYNKVTQGKAYLMYNLRYNKKYDVTKHCFLFDIGFDDLYRYSQPGYLCFENGLALTFPTAYLSRKRQSSNLATNGIYNYNTLKTTTISEAMALKIEDEMDDPYCNARLLLIFKLTNTATERKQVSNWIIPQHFVIGKTIAAYIVNEKTGEIYADMTKIFNQSVGSRTNTQRKR